MNQNPIKLAICPRCGINWKWDWCQDTYRAKPDIWARQTTIAVDKTRDHVNDLGWSMDDEDRVIPHTKFGVDIDLYICKCGKIIGFNVSDDDGSDIFNHPEWNEVDWDREAWEDC